MNHTRSTRETELTRLDLRDVEPRPAECLSCHE